jgi:hypothetical protein
MRIFLAILAIIAISYSFISQPLYEKIQEHLPERTLQIFFMQSFNNDSIRLSSSLTNDRRLRVRAQQSAQDTASKMVLQMSPQDTTVIIRNITGNDSVTAKYRGERYLYVYYEAPKYTMRFSNKAIFVEWWPREIRDSVKSIGR